MTELRVSLIMTVLNEERGLDGFLRSVEAQRRRPDEVVVVDGGSSDRTVEVLEKWGRATRVPTRVITRAGANISEGRNLAIRSASHDLIAVTDAGTLLDPEWLSSLLAAWNGKVDVVSGFFEPMWSTPTERLIASVITPTLDEIDPQTFLPSSRSLLISRDAWAVAGGYPEWLDYCEDLVFDLSMQQAGMRFAFAGDAISRWAARPTLRAYAKQYYRYARGDGKAGLWRKRHMARYGAYGLGLVGLASPGPVPRTLRAAALGIGFAGYTNRYYRRVWKRRPADAVEMGGLLAAVPVVLVVGDVAKMAGYPVGVWWRASRTRGRRS